MKYYLFNPLAKKTKQTLLIGRTNVIERGKTTERFRFAFFTHNEKFPNIQAWREQIDRVCSIGGFIMDENSNVLFPDEFFTYVDHLQYHANPGYYHQGWHYRFAAKATIRQDAEGYNMVTHLNANGENDNKSATKSVSRRSEPKAA